MNKIFELGIAETNETYQNQSIKISNKIALIIISGGLLYSILSLIYAPKLTIIPLVLIVGSLIILLLNKYYFTDISRVFLAILFTSMVALFHAFPVAKGQPLMLHFYVAQFIIALLPWIIIDIREKYILLITLLFNYLVFIIQPWLNMNFNMNVESAWLRSDLTIYITYIGSITVAILAMELIQSRFIESDNHAAKVSGEIEDKISEMENRQKELQKKLDEINKSYKDEENRSWIASGLTEITNLMRQAKSEKIFPELIEAITKYMSVAQGAIYMVKEDNNNQEQYIELEGCFAFDRRKFIEKKIRFGDGLLGQSCLEQEIIKINKVPDTFVEITTGLGDTPPNNLVIVPLIYDEKVMGVLEMLAYNPYSDYEVEFLQQLGENIASFISNNLINIKTKELLEQSQQQAEEMRAQEEEMRQNMEELQATQEEMARKEKEYLQKIEELENKAKRTTHQNMHVNG